MGGAPMGGPANPYGAPPPGGAPVASPDYGAAPGPGMGGAMVPAGGSAMAPMGGGGMAPMGGGGGGPLAAGPPGVIRNPMVALAVTCFCCPWFGFFQCMKAEEELNKFLGKSQGGNILWLLFPLIPALAMPKLIAEARAKAGTPAQGEGNLVGYIFLASYLFLKDANEIWESQGVKPS
jgi:hypothetical protein